jgi:hypothetical protein
LPSESNRPRHTFDFQAITKASAKLVAALSGIPGGSEAIDLLMALVDVEDAQLAALRCLDEKIDLLLGGPMKAAKVQLESAGRVSRESEAWHRHVTQASVFYSEAIGLAKNWTERSLVEYGYGITCLLLKEDDNAEEFLARSHKSASTAVEALVLRCVSFVKSPVRGLPHVIDQRTDADPPPRAAVWKQFYRTTLIVLDGLTIPMATFKLRGDGKEAMMIASMNIEMLMMCLEFYNVVQYSYSQVTPNFTPVYLALRQNRADEKQWLLEVADRHAWPAMAVPGI